MGFEYEIPLLYSLVVYLATGGKVLPSYTHRNDRQGGSLTDYQKSNPLDTIKTLYDLIKGLVPDKGGQPGKPPDINIPPAFRADVSPGLQAVFERLYPDSDFTSGFLHPEDPNRWISTPDSTALHTILLQDETSFDASDMQYANYNAFHLLRGINDTPQPPLTEIDVYGIHLAGRFAFTDNSMSLGGRVTLTLVRTYRVPPSDLKPPNLWQTGVVDPAYSDRIVVLAHRAMEVPPIDPSSNQSDWHVVPFMLTDIEHTWFDFRDQEGLGRRMTGPDDDHNYYLVVRVEDYTNGGAIGSYRCAGYCHVWYDYQPFDSNL